MGNPTNQDSFLQLMESHRGILYKISQAFCGNPADRDDLAQEMLLTLWKGYSKYDPELRFSTWMYRVALNVAISWYRKKRRTAPTLSVEEMSIDPADHPPDTETREQRDLLQQSIRELPELDRALIILYFEEKPYREIAVIIGITETNVATRISRIREKLKQRITNLQKTVYGRQ